MFQNVHNVRKKQNHAMIRAEMEKQHAGQSFLLNPYVKNSIIIICMIADMATLYSIFELRFCGGPHGRSCSRRRPES